MNGDLPDAGLLPQAKDFVDKESPAVGIGNICAVGLVIQVPTVECLSKPCLPFPVPPKFGMEGQGYNSLRGLRGGGRRIRSSKSSLVATK